ncbi:MAG TPA: hypothetical protein VNZ93_16700 [Pseudorhodoplanes sp.]|nr:hypothetical protein [Pseudorhodoplanes sp.]
MVSKKRNRVAPERGPIELHDYKPSQGLVDQMATLAEERTGKKPTDGEAEVMLQRLVATFKLLHQWDREAARKTQDSASVSTEVTSSDAE